MRWRMLAAGSLRVLRRYKLRTFFMSLGVVVGVAALVVMRSMGSGTERGMLDKLERMFGASSVMVVNGGSGMHGGRRQPGELRIEDLEAIADRLEQVVAWDPVVVADGREVRYRGTTRSLLVAGHSERAMEVWGRGVSAGEFFTAADRAAASRVALLGPKTAASLFGDEDPLGKQIQIAGAPFRVKGVLEEYGFDPHGMDRDDEVHVPVTTMMRRVVNRDTIGSAKINLAAAEEVDRTADEIAAILRERHGLAEGEPDDFSIFTPAQVQRIIRQANRVLTVYLPATAGIALLVAAIVIANLMLIGVRERLVEIGLRKAVGATDRQIAGQFLLEGLAVTAVSGLLGVGLGAVILGVVAAHANPETRLSADSVVLGLVAALLVGTLAAFLPARRAALQEPADTLK